MDGLADISGGNFAGNLTEGSSENSNYFFDLYNERANLNFLHGARSQLRAARINRRSELGSTLTKRKTRRYLAWRSGDGVVVEWLRWRCVLAEWLRSGCGEVAEWSQNGKAINLMENTCNMRNANVSGLAERLQSGCGVVVLYFNALASE